MNQKAGQLVAEEYTQRISGLLSRMAVDLRSRGHSSTILEGIACRFLNVAFGWKLKNLNLEKLNYPAVDLGDDDHKVAVQVTVSDDTDKIKETAERSARWKLSERFDQIIILAFSDQEISASLKSKSNIIYWRLKEVVSMLEAGHVTPNISNLCPPSHRDLGPERLQLICQTLEDEHRKAFIFTESARSALVGFYHALSGYTLPWDRYGKRAILRDVAVAPTVERHVRRRTDTTPTQPPRVEVVTERLVWQELWREQPTSLVLGGPGTGKTVLARLSALEMATEGIRLLADDQTQPHSLPLPIFLSLPQVAKAIESGHLDFARVIIQALHPRAYSTELDDWLFHRITLPTLGTEVLFLLDALDQVPETHHSAITSFFHWLRSKHARCITTCRSEHGVARLASELVLNEAEVHRFTLPKLSRDEFMAITAKWLTQEHFQRLSVQLKAVPQSTEVFCQSRLLAALACQSAEVNATLPTQTGAAIQLLIESLAARSHQSAVAGTSGFTKADILRPLPLIAWTLIQAQPEGNLLPESILFIAIQYALTQCGCGGGAEKYRDQLISSGIIQPEAHQNGEVHLAFAHRSILEFLAAKYLADEINDSGLQDTKVVYAPDADTTGLRKRFSKAVKSKSDCLTAVSAIIARKSWDSSWHNTIHFLPGLLSDSQILKQLLDIILNGNPDDLHSHRLTLASRCLSSVDWMKHSVIQPTRDGIALKLLKTVLSTIRHFEGPMSEESTKHLWDALPHLCLCGAVVPVCFNEAKDGNERPGGWGRQLTLLESGAHAHFGRGLAIWLRSDVLDIANLARRMFDVCGTAAASEACVEALHESLKLGLTGKEKEDAWLICYAADALAQTGSVANDELVWTLMELVTEKEERTSFDRGSCCGALAACCKDSAFLLQASQFLQTKLKQNPGDYWAISGLEKLGDRSAIPVLMQQAKLDPPKNFETSINALHELGCPEHVIADLVEEALISKERRLAAAEYLGGIFWGSRLPSKLVQLPRIKSALIAASDVVEYSTLATLEIQGTPITVERCNEVFDAGDYDAIRNLFLWLERHLQSFPTDIQLYGPAVIRFVVRQLSNGSGPGGNGDSVLARAGETKEGEKLISDLLSKSYRRDQMGYIFATVYKLGGTVLRSRPDLAWKLMLLHQSAPDMFATRFIETSFFWMSHVVQQSVWVDEAGIFVPPATIERWCEFFTRYTVKIGNKWIVEQLILAAERDVSCATDALASIHYATDKIAELLIASLKTDCLALRRAAAKSLLRLAQEEEHSALLGQVLPALAFIGGVETDDLCEMAVHCTKAGQSCLPDSLREISIDKADRKWTENKKLAKLVGAGWRLMPLLDSPGEYRLALIHEISSV